MDKARPLANVLLGDETSTTTEKMMKSRKPDIFDLWIRVKALEKRMKRMEVVIYFMMGAQFLAGGITAQKFGELFRQFFGIH